MRVPIRSREGASYECQQFTWGYKKNQLVKTSSIWSDDLGVYRYVKIMNQYYDDVNGVQINLRISIRRQF